MRFLVVVFAVFGAATGAIGAATLVPSLAGTLALAGLIVAVIVRSLLRHLTSRRDGVVAGLIAGPLAMAPANVFFVAMTAFLLGIVAAKLPSHVMLAALDLRRFTYCFKR